MRCYCIGDEDTVRGFRLAGVKGWVVGSPPDAHGAFRAVLEQPDAGIVILTRAAAGWIGEPLQILRLERDHPLVLVIPGPEGGAVGPDDLGALVRSAIGMRLEPSTGG